MESISKPYELDKMMEAAGMCVKYAYTIPEVSRASCVPYETVLASVKEGRIKTFLPPGRARGRLVKAEWFEEWWKEGLENAG